MLRSIQPRSANVALEREFKNEPCYGLTLHTIYYARQRVKGELIWRSLKRAGACGRLVS